MVVRPIVDRERWTLFLLAHAPRSGAFLHSWEWGEMRRVLRVGFFEGEELVGIASLESHVLPFGSRYVFCPRGPVFSTGATKEKNLFATLSQFCAREKGVFFVRLEPTKAIKPPGGIKLVPSASVSPSRTLILNLQPTLDELLTNMHPKTRYNIRLADRKGVKIQIQKWSDRTKSETPLFDAVWPMFIETAKRDRFRMHPRGHYERILQQIPGAFLAVASLDGSPLAANIMIDFAGVRTYLHGASRSVARQVMAPHVLHWELMKDAKARGLRAYDWWGIADEDSPPARPASAKATAGPPKPGEGGGGVKGGWEQHAWAGITRFKKGFGGEEVSYPGTFDLVLDPLRYGMYTGARSLLKKIRDCVR